MDVYILLRRKAVSSGFILLAEIPGDNYYNTFQFNFLPTDLGLSSVGNLTVTWFITENETNGTAHLRLDDDGETFHRILHHFQTVGTYKICKYAFSNLEKGTKKAQAQIMKSLEYEPHHEKKIVYAKNAQSSWR